MVRDTPSPGPRAGPSPGAKRRGPRAKSLRRTLGPSLSPFQERLKETDFYTKPLTDKFDAMSSVKVGIISLTLGFNIREKYTHSGCIFLECLVFNFS